MERSIPARAQAASRLGLIAAITLWAANSPGATDNTPAATNALSVELQYQETTYSLGNFSAHVIPAQQKEIARLPAASGRLEPGFMTIAGNCFAVARDSANRRLYIDRNRNLDLTDDADGISPAAGDVYTNVQLAITNANGRWRLLVDLDWGDPRRRQWRRVTLKSFYGGQTELGGKSWQIGVIIIPWDAPAPIEDQCFIRRWDERNQPLQAMYNNAEAMFLPSAPLFVENTLYAPALITSLTGPSEDTHRIEFAPQAAELGEIRFEGEYVRRLTLQRRQKTVAVYSDPARMVRAPLGVYDSALAWLEHGGTRATGQRHEPVRVSSGSPALLAIGGPLTNSVQVSRKGRMLVMQYRIRGVGQGLTTYELAEVNRAKPPRYEIYKDGRRLAAGQFQFG